MKSLISILVLLFLCFSVYANDEMWADRSTPDAVTKAWQSYKQLFLANKNYETAWKFARAAHYYSSNVLTAEQNDKRKVVLEEGKNAAEFAMKANPAGVEGHYYFGVCLGSWAEANGVLSSLFAVGDLVKSMDNAVRINRSFENAGPLMARGRVYHKAPGWPVSVGDKDKAEADYRAAMAIASDSRVLHRFYAEFLIDQNRKSEALKLLEKALTFPFKTDQAFADEIEIARIKRLIEKAKS